MIRAALLALRLLGLAGVCGLALATGTPALLDERTESIDLWPQVRMLDDPGRALTVEKVLQVPERFIAPRAAYATLGMDKVVVWLRVPITVSAGGAGTWILDFDYALLHRVDAWVVREGKIVKHVALGTFQPFAQRPLRGRSHAASLEFAQAGPAELLMRVDTPGAKILPLSLSRLSSFHERALDEHMLQGALTGLGFLLLLYSLAQWASLRQALYWKYALLVLCSVTFSAHFFGIGEVYVWTDWEWPARHMAGVSALLAAGATALFIEDALAGDLNPSLRLALRAVALVHGVAAVAHGLDWIDIQTVAIFMTTTGLAPSLLGLPGAIAKWRRGDAVGAWFIVAWVGYFIASAIMVGVVRGQIGANFWTLHSFQFGATLDMLVFMRIVLLRTATRHRDAQRAVQERDTLHSLAHTDPLTGLLNRRGLDDLLAGALARATSQHLLAVYVIDLDDFKPVNDQFGHDVGDDVLRKIAQRLRASVRAGDGVARIGGDEFVVMAVGFTHESLAVDLGGKLREAFHSPFQSGVNLCSVSATIGYALAPTDAADAGSLLKAADAAMYAGKQKGKDQLLRVGG
jgi:diguanylate cyclase (GGDEF)-like protein